MSLLHEDLTDRIIKSFYDVYNDLGYGFLEKVYENALYVELQLNHLQCDRQRPIQVFYKDQKVGEYYADIIVEDLIIVELKAAETIAEEHECQLINYLRATEMEVGLLLNFGKSAQFKRKIFTNDKKRINSNK